jgi:hypothetical protein
LKTIQPRTTAELSEINKLEVNKIAEALTHEDNRLYKEIRFTELLDQAWNKDKLRYDNLLCNLTLFRHRSPNIMKNINFLNKVSSWVSFTILNQEDTPHRIKIIQKFIRVLSV